MPDWTKQMQQTFEYQIVDPGTWKDMQPLNIVKSSSIERDSGADTLGSASIDITDLVGECYIRIYLITVQNGIRERFPLGTFLVQTPSSKFDGKVREVTMDAYTPLMELKENPPPIGYFVPKDTNIMDTVYQLSREHMRGPVVSSPADNKLYSDFVADTSDTWLSFIKDLLSNAKREIALDELGRVIFQPKQDTESLQPVCTFDDSNSSILYPEFTMDHDLYGIPNIVEVIYSKGRDYYYSKAVNDDPNSPTSIISRGREIIHRVTDPDMIGDPTKNQIKEYADRLLRELSSVEYTVTYTHGYNGNRVGDCVLLNYERAGIIDVKARVISQSIKCEPGCPVTEKATFTNKLWR